MWFCLEAGWKIWYDYGKMADLGNPVKMNKTGENDIPTAVLIKLADLYDTTTDYILGREDKK